MEDSILFTLLSFVGLLFCSAFFSASETSITAISRAKLHKLVTEGNKRAKLVTKLRENKDNLIGGILLGNNAVNTGATAMATALAIQIFGDNGVAIATVVVTILILMFGEVLPKSIAFSFPERFALFLAPFLYPFIFIVRPITNALRFMTEAVRKVLHLKPNPDFDMTGLDILRGAIELHHQEGIVVKKDRDMLGSIIDLEEIEVSHIMIHRKNIEMIDIDAPIGKIMHDAMESTYTRIPLYQKSPDNIIGILHIKDLLRFTRQHAQPISKQELKAILRTPWYIPRTTTLKKQLTSFLAKKNHFSLVVDEYGVLLGLITLEDILEEIVGQIEDEHDITTPGIRKLSANEYAIEGSVTVRDLNRELDLKLPDAKASTLAGLIIYKARLIPEMGQKFRFFGLRFEILKKTRNQITRVKITLPKKQNRN